MLKLEHTHREPVKTALTSVALSRRSVNKSQHCPKGSIRGNGRLVLSRLYLYWMEVYWFPLMGPWKTCVPCSIIWACAFDRRQICSWIGEKHHLVRCFFPASHRNLFFPVPPLFKTSWLFVKLDQPSWPTSTSISGISTSKLVTTCCFLSYSSSPHVLVLTATFSTASTRHTKRGSDNRATMLWRYAL